jgi:lipoprotein-anchoring transpeptidase ErfK/SrfK
VVTFEGYFAHRGRVAVGLVGVGRANYNPALRTGGRPRESERAVAVSGVTRGGWVAVGAGALAVASGSAFAGVQYANRVEVGAQVPAPDSAVATSRPLVALDATNVDGMRDLKVLIDGKDRTGKAARTEDGRIVVPAGRLAEGAHTVDVKFATRNVFSRSVRRTWTFTVDTKIPPLTVKSPAPGSEINSKRVVLNGTSEPNTTVRVAWKGGVAKAVAGPKGGWKVAAKVPEGPVALRVSATDLAGNAAVTRRRVVVDTTPPALQLAKTAAKLTGTDAPVFYGKVSGETPARVIVGATVNGREIVARHGVSGADQNGDPVAGVAFTGRQFALSVGRLPQGRNDVKVFVRDPAGNHSQKAITVTVDSTEDFGSRDLVKGARGADVKELQRQLVDRGFKRTKVTGIYDERTVRSVKNYQRVHKIKQSGVFGPNTRTAFVGKIVVTLGKFRLQLIRDGKVVNTYRVAVGQSAYPTPTGTYRIVNKQRDPTWTPPPDSSWAKGLGPIPPGPGNPLGTRWMGTSAPYVGIHGTYAASSIGTRASHGCIRMHIKDVEELYEDVSVGMPVQLRA